MRPPRVRRTGWSALVLSLLFAPTAHALPSIVSIGNDPSTQNGDYVNAAEIANTLAFTSVWIEAEQSVRVVDPSDLSISPFFGPTVFDVTLAAPESIEVLADLKMGAGSVHFRGPLVRLEGVLQDADGNALDQTRLSSNAQQIDVGSGGRAEQASWLAWLNPGNPVLIRVNGATDPGLINVWDNTRLELQAGFLENVTLTTANSRFDWTGGQLGETGLFGFGGTVEIHGSGFELGPYVVCNTIPGSGWSPAPASLTNSSGCLRGTLASGEPFMTVFNFAGTIHLIPVSSPAPVPTTGWLLAPVALLAGWAAARRRLST